MPQVIDYSVVLESMTSAGFKSLYHNSGAFGFSRSQSIRHCGWIGPADSTLRPAAIPFVRSVPAQFESNLASAATKVWTESIRGNLWLLPMSHWAYELDANDAWLAPALQSAGVDAEALKNRNTGDAIEFAPGESQSFTALCGTLLKNLTTSDYMIAFPPKLILCTLHHHKQLWWSTTDKMVYAAVDAIFPATRNSI